MGRNQKLKATCVIDPGLDGAAVYFENDVPVEGLEFARAMKSSGLSLAAELGAFLNRIDPWGDKELRIVLERPMPFREQSIVSTAKQFFNIGVAHAVASFLGYEVEEINPTTWTNWLKKQYPVLSQAKKLKKKSLSRKHAYANFPTFSKRFVPPRGYLLHDGIADCLTIYTFLLSR